MKYKKHIRKKADIIKNEDGSTIVMALIMLAILTIIGISASTTSVTELQIVRNERIYQNNFYLAESSVMEAAQRLDNFDGITDYDILMARASPTKLGWINNASASPDFEISSNWNTSNSIPSLANTSCSFTVVFIKSQAGSSMKIGDQSVNLYAIYGLSQIYNGEVLIDIGCKKPVKIQ